MECHPDGVPLTQQRIGLIMQKDEHIFISDAKGSRIVHLDEACISPYDHGLLYGDGVFEGIRIYNGRIFRFEEHIDRLYSPPRASDWRSPFPRTNWRGKLSSFAERTGSRTKGTSGRS